MDFLPIYFDMHGQKALVVGGGEIALRKTRLLLEAGAMVTLVAPEFDMEISDLPRDRVTLFQQNYSTQFLGDQRLVIAATDNEDINERVFIDAEALGIPVNSVDDPAHSRFIFPAIVDRTPIIISISSGGHAPVLARQIREKLESILPQSVATIGQFAKEMRSRVKARFPFELRRRFWEQFFNGPIPLELERGQRDKANTLFEEALATDMHSGGEVYIVGAGPGDPELLTIKALQCLHKADVIVHDGLVSNEIMALARRDAQRISVAKSAGKHTLPQDEINQLLITLALDGKRVCRLKGGDPFMYARGGEECEALASAGIPYVIVPGITAAAGCTAYAGIPLTHRDLAQTVQLVTGHTRSNGMEPDWHSLAASQQTLVVYMGIGTSLLWSKRLIEFGRCHLTPVAIIQDGTRQTQRVIITDLANLHDAICAFEIQSPALVVIGEVSTLAHRLHWFGAPPLTQSTGQNTESDLEGI